MLNNLNNFPNLPRIAQKNSYYCAPAVIQMLSSLHGFNLNQDKIVQSLGLQHKIATHGMTIQEIGYYFKNFIPQLQFWFKFNSNIADLSQLVNQHRIPVAVEWQGIFTYDTPEEAEEDDPGHYSIVTHIDTAYNTILLIDPYENDGTDRKLSILQFERRWWDINEIIDPHTGRRQEVDDFHTLFFVTPKETILPDSLNLIRL